ncbi:MAG: hypothetical protein CYPHOPRED_005536 [Cyphobasidiales sp. Tagirdzhanova-0007]|nr:MAG: hypothetical protein CYPHOPRED_005536 [Cyphobasidiales sp. Tagirdzhanova-0007]
MAASAPTFKRYVEVGRVVLVNEGPQAGKLATIVEIIDHARALIDGPESGVPRQAIAYKKVVLTPYVLKKLPRAAGSTAVSKVWKASGVDEKWEKSAWAKKRATQMTRRSLSDFDRFKVQIFKSERRKTVGKELKKAKASS